jgi:hypothetical protein
MEVREMSNEQGMPALHQLTEEERQFLHYNPNTPEVEEWVHNYAREYAAQQAAELREEVAKLDKLTDEQSLHISDLAHRNGLLQSRLDEAVAVRDDFALTLMRARRDQVLHLVELAQDIGLPDNVIHWLRAEAGKLIEIPGTFLAKQEAA